MKQLSKFLVLIIVMIPAIASAQYGSYKYTSYSKQYGSYTGYTPPSYTPYKSSYVAPVAPEKYYSSYSNYSSYKPSYTPSYTPSYNSYTPSYKSSYTPYQSSYTPSSGSGSSYNSSYTASSYSSQPVYTSEADYDNMVSSYTSNKDYKQAAAYADKIVESHLPPEKQKSLNDWKLVCYYMAEETDKIVSMFNSKSIILNTPNNYTEVGYAYQQKQQYNEAVKYYEKANILTRSTVDKEFIYDAAFSYYKLEDFDKALTYSNRYVAEGGDETSIYYFIGYSNFRLYYDNNGTTDKLDNAISAYTTLITSLETTKSEKRQSVYASRAQARFFKRDFAGAISDCDMQLKYTPTDLFSFEVKAECKSHMNDNAGGIAVIEQAMKLTPENSDLYNERAYFKALSKNYTGAMTDVNKSLELKGNDGNALDTKGYILFKLNKYADALTFFNKAVETNPQKQGGITFYYRGLAKQKLNDKAGACEDWHKAIEHHMIMNQLVTTADAEKMIKTYCK